MSRKKSPEQKYLEILKKFSTATKENIQEFYIEKQFSLPDLQKQFGWHSGISLFLINYFGYNARTMSESRKTFRTKEKFEKTILEKYGVKNPSCSNEIKEKKANTFIKNYGVDNIWKTKEYTTKLHETMLEKYGAKSVPNLHGNANCFGWKTITPEQKSERLNKAHEGFHKFFNSLTDEQKTEYVIKRCKGFNYCSSLESKIMMCLENLQIKNTHQKWIDKRPYDFHIKNTKILLEINGDFWHANPQIYQKNDILEIPGGKKTAKELWEKDLEKEKIAVSKGYKVIYIWEYEIKNKTQPEIMQLILEKLNGSSKD